MMVEKIETTERFYYGMRQRGCSPGCQPKDGFVERMDDPSGMYYDIISYSKKLSLRDEQYYDLAYLGADK